MAEPRDRPTPGATVPACRTCGGVRVGLDVVGQNTGLHPPGRLIGFGPLSRMRALVCLGCGEATLYASELNDLRNEAERHPERFVW